MIVEKTKKELIFIEAAKLFQSKGYAATSMRDLAAHVGLKPSSFYSHIKSKEEILEIICKKAAALFSNGLEDILRKKLSPSKTLELVIDLHVDIAFSNPSAITVFNDEWKHLTGEALQAFRSNRKSYQDAIIQIIKDGISNNSVKTLDATIIFNTIIGGTRWLHFINNPSDAMANRIRKQLKEILLQGFVQA